MFRVPRWPNRSARLWTTHPPITKYASVVMSCDGTNSVPSAWVSAACRPIAGPCAARAYRPIMRLVTGRDNATRTVHVYCSSVLKHGIDWQCGWTRFRQSNTKLLKYSQILWKEYIKHVKTNTYNLYSKYYIPTNGIGRTNIIHLRYWSTLTKPWNLNY